MPHCYIFIFTEIDNAMHFAGLVKQESLDWIKFFLKYIILSDLQELY